MWDVETSKKLAEILNLIATPGELRPHPHNPSAELFDGGERTVLTGITVFKFSDGSEAVFGTGLNIALTVTLPRGERLSIESSHEHCNGCFERIPVDTRFCPRCGKAQ